MQDFAPSATAFAAWRRQVTGAAISVVSESCVGQATNADIAHSKKGSEENSIHLSEKRARGFSMNHVTVLFRGGICSGSRHAGSGFRVPKSSRQSMIMKFCPNYRCAAYGRLVYTQTTRCVFCRWDLQPPRMKSETLYDAPVSSGTTSSDPEGHSQTSSPEPHPNPAIRHSA